MRNPRGFSEQHEGVLTGGRRERREKHDFGGVTGRSKKKGVGIEVPSGIKKGVIDGVREKKASRQAHD